MSMKIDQSLDDISKATRAQRGARRPAPRRVGAKAKTTAPVGGIQKKSQPAAKGRAAAKTATAALPLGESKIIVSGLPVDVSEEQIKEYFNKTIGAVKKVLLTYGSNGRSRGIATITFNKIDSAHKAASQLHGVKVDNKPMSIEVVVGAAQASAPAAAKGLGDRIAKPKSAVKAEKKSAPTKVNGAGPANKRKGKPARKGASGRPKTKTAEELDAEMTDYFDAGGNAAGAAMASGSNGAAGGQVTANGGDGMDEVL